MDKPSMGELNAAAIDEICDEAVRLADAQPGDKKATWRAAYHGAMLAKLAVMNTRTAPPATSDEVTTVSPAKDEVDVRELALREAADWLRVNMGSLDTINTYGATHAMLIELGIDEDMSEAFEHRRKHWPSISDDEPIPPAALSPVDRLREALERIRNGLRAYLPGSRVSTPVSMERLIEIIDAALSSPEPMGEEDS